MDTSKYTHVCHICQAAFAGEDNLQVHLWLHASENPYVWEISNTDKENFVHRKSLNNLDELVKQQADENLYTCNICNNKFTQKNDLDAHLMLHVSKEDFDRHSRVHTGEKPHICATCGKAFTRKGTLNEHYRLHTGEKPHICDTCGKSFTHKGNLIEHYRLHTGEKPYVCERCGKAFTQKGHLNEHYRLHTGEKPYVCDRCGMAFTQRGNLLRHIRRHTK